jgi:predicted nucleotidyltransferase
MLFERLVEAELDDETVKTEVNRLLEAKKNTSELGTSRRIPVLNEYIQKELVLLKNEVSSLSKEQTSWDKLNEFFIRTVMG